MRPMRPLGILLLLGGCRPTAVAEPAPAVAPSPSSVERTPGAPTVPVVLVDQRTLTDVPAGFDPTGRIYVSTNCSAWNEVGYFLGMAPQAECRRWQRVPARPSPAGERMATAEGSSVELSGPGVSGTLSCTDCPMVQDLAWSPDGERLAIVREGRPTVEIWSVTTGRRSSELTLSPATELSQLQLAWPEALYVLMEMVDDRSECDYTEDEEDDCINEWEAEGHSDGPWDYALVTFTELDEPPTTEPVAPTDYYQYLASARLDPRGRCLYLSEFNISMRDDLDARVTAVSLAGVCPMGQDEPDEAEPQQLHELMGGDVWRSSDASWVDGPTPRLMTVLSTVDDDSEYEEGLESTYYEIRVRELSSDGRAWMRELDAIELPLQDARNAWVRMVDRTLVDARVSDAGIETAWHHCFELVTHRPGEAERARPWCESSLDLPHRCELRDLAPDADGVLARCGRRTGSLTWLAGDTRVDLKVKDGAKWTWGRGWLVTVETDSGVRLHPLSAVDRPVELGPAHAWVPMTMGPALDRVLLHVKARVRLLDGQGTERTTAQIHIGAPVHAALSASAGRLALTDGQRIEVIDLSDGRSVKTWSAPDARFIAWRQDERILWSGDSDEEPTAAWDPSEGVAVPDAIPDLRGYQLDPTWRWSVLTSNRVMRMLDGQELWFDDAGALLDSGLYEGRPAALSGVMYRLGEDPLSSPVVGAEHVRAVVERKGLVEDFFAGRALSTEPAMITPAQRDALAEAARPDALARVERARQLDE